MKMFEDVQCVIYNSKKKKNKATDELEYNPNSSMLGD